MPSEAHAGGGFFSQPRAVWAVAFAAVVSFMGLGLPAGASGSSDAIAMPPPCICVSTGQYCRVGGSAGPPSWTRGCL
ncbi:MAG TPA: hypothetical protein VN880_09955, partial [Solirubrobacteraceae bacterium]|nr:hypothetical protein [Solirubrobacteraceae bacterium]